MLNTIYIRLETLSPLFIGGSPIPFEIGGIDQQTATDSYKHPCIPGSSLKGMHRLIVREDSNDMAKEISNMYHSYLEKVESNNLDFIEQRYKDEPEARAKILQKYTTAKKNVSAEYLFGLESFNNTPKLLFSDLLLCRESIEKADFFSIDMKNSIDVSGEAPRSNPRTYKTARSGLVFEGQIQLYKIEELGKTAKSICENYIKYTLMKFNDGVYRLGNSKSRGYGKVKVTFLDLRC